MPAQGAGSAWRRIPRAAARAGATREEVAEALGVALLMRGGPASVNAPRVWETFLEFSEEDVGEAEVGGRSVVRPLTWSALRT